MCKFISFLHNPATGELLVKDLESHANTEKALGLDLKVFREGHYTPDGTIEARVCSEDRKTAEECAASIRLRWPTFIDFFNWCMKETGQTETFGGALYLSGLTSAKGLVLPKSIGGSLYLSGLTSAKFLVLPKSIGCALYLNANVRAEMNL